MSGIILRHRDDGVLELRVNGVFVMDDHESTSEELLATEVLNLGAHEILVGGLGLGFTLRALLNGGAEQVVVVEREPDLVEAMRDGTIPGADLLADPRCTIVVEDVLKAVPALPPDSLDAIVLDVDNGPDFLVHESNAEVYQNSFVDQCARVLRPTGHLVVWSMNDSAPLAERLAQRFAAVVRTEVPVMLQDRDERYWLIRGSGR